MALDIDWGILKPVDIGANFQSGFQMGQQMREKAQMKSALAAYSQDPNNPEVQNALASVDDRFAMQLGQYRAGAPEREAAQQEKLTEKHRENIVMGAKLIRQTKPTDQATWDQTRALAQQAGIDVSEVPPQFDPQYIDGLTKLADTFDPPKSGEMPGIAKEVDYYRGIGRDDLAQQLLERHAEGPPMVVDNGDGTKTIYQRGAMGGSAPQSQGTAPPPPHPFVLDGGPTQPASGGFP